jgi:hypothetical protein
MKKAGITGSFAVLIVILFLLSLEVVFASMTVFLKDGRVVSVPVNRDDIISITFEEGPFSKQKPADRMSLPVTDGLVMWLDAADHSTLFQSSRGGDPVSAGNQPIGLWRDKSGNENHFVQPKLESRPLYVKTGIGGKPSVAFETRQSMSMAKNFPAPVTVMYVARQMGAGGRVLTGVANNWLLGYWSGGKNQAYYGGWVSSGGRPASDSLAHVFTAVIRGQGQDSEVWADGSQVASNRGGIEGPNGLAVNGGAYSGEASNCQIAEIVVFNRVLKQSESQTVESYLISKWRIGQ